MSTENKESFAFKVQEKAIEWEKEYTTMKSY